jgi:hypothetical protein
MSPNLHKFRSDKKLPWLLALLLALAIAPRALLAQVPDPTGAWLLKWHFEFGTGTGTFVLNVFHQGGTLTGDIQGESAFDPHATIAPTSGEQRNPMASQNSMASKLPMNVITSPQSGVWQKTGFNTFAATFLVIEYQVQTKPPASTLFQLSKAQYFGTLNASANTMELTVHIAHYNENGELIDGVQEFGASGVRIPLEILPHTADTLPIPP